jgi:sulfide dehydrogenase cytochrome subunit
LRELIDARKFAVRARISASILLAFGAAALPIARADITALLPMCNACHGTDGVSQLPGVPTIAGVSALVTENALIDYRARARPCVTQLNSDRIAMDMCGPATLVAEQDLGAIADYYAGLGYHAKTQQTDAAKVAIGREIHDRECEICHVDGGRDPNQDTGILAGQDFEYLLQALEDYARGARPMSRPKQVSFANLSSEDLEALAHFYAAQQ